CCFCWMSTLPLYHLTYSHSGVALNRTIYTFPTRRSSDLFARRTISFSRESPTRLWSFSKAWRAEILRSRDCRQGLASFIIRNTTDRKSTRLNSSHLGISYAVFCLKKKK